MSLRVISSNTYKWSISNFIEPIFAKVVFLSVDFKETLFASEKSFRQSCAFRSSTLYVGMLIIRVCVLLSLLEEEQDTAKIKEKPALKNNNLFILFVLKGSLIGNKSKI